MRVLNFTFLLLWMAGALLLGGCNGDATGDGNGTPMLGYTVSGTISASANTLVDNDVNDEMAYYQSNDDARQAQAIPNPVILGGYVNQAGAGTAGRSKNSGDSLDYYQVDLLAGQTVNLFIGASDVYYNDLDLYLLDGGENVVNASESRGDTENLTVQSNGRYYLVVQAYRGAANYILSIGQTAASARAAGMRLSDEFAPGQLTVEFRQDMKTSQAVQAASAELGIKAVAGEASRRMLFEIDDSRPRALSAGPFRFADAELQRKHETLQAVKGLLQRPDVARADPNYVFRAQRVPNDSLYRYQWHYSMINLPQAWDMTTGSPNVVAAVIDTGILHSHPDIRGKTVSGYDFISDKSISVDGDGIDSNPEDPGDQSTSGSTFHGTHVAGTIGALTNNGDGVAGVGWQTKIMPLRVLGKNGAGYDYDIEQAVRYAAGMSNDSRSVPAQRADIINMSLGGENISSGFQALVNEVRNRGIFFVSASGNDGKNLINYPAALNGVISVAAVDINRQRAFYSNYHSTVDVAAPGGDVSSDINGDGVNDGVVSTVGDDSAGSVRYIFAPSMGTSMATPHITGVIALMKAVHPGLTPQDFDNLLALGKITEDLGAPGKDSSYGYGLINAYKAVLAAADLAGGNGAGPAPATPQLTVTPATLNFGLTASSQSLTVGNAGGGALSVSQITSSANFVSVYQAAVDGNGLGTYTVSVNRGGLPQGTYRATLRFISSANTVEVDVLLQVSNQVQAGNAGRQYVLLVDPSNPTGDPIKQTQVSASGGAYRYSFSGVPGGTYILVSGSDLNQDLYICDAGESCGAFLTLDQPSILTVDRNLSGVDFSVNFTTDFLSKSAFSAGEEQAEQAARAGFRRLPEAGEERRLGQ